MADQPAFSRCPYCQRKLEKRPQRKSKCPHCAEVIYVRGDDLLRADEVEAATRPRKTARKPAKVATGATGKKSTKKSSKGAAKKPKTATTATSSAKKQSPRRKAKPASSLVEALLNQAQGAFRPGDLQAGILLVVQLLGKFLKPEQIPGLLGSLFGGDASRTAFVDIDQDALMAEASDVYADLDADQQRQMLAVFAWMQNGFKLDESG